MLRENNCIKLIGKIAETLKFDHEVLGEKMYVSTLEVERRSGKIDKVPLRISERVLKSNEIKPGTQVRIEGECRSFNEIACSKSHLIVDVFVKNIMEVDDESECVNEAKITGYICKQPLYRITPLGREITDIMISVSRPFSGKYDYIPCIVWGKNARWAKNLNIGNIISLVGRFQSRDYIKLVDEEALNKTAIEISANYITLEE